MPVVTIEWFAGRDADIKKDVVDKVTAALVDNGVPQEQVWIKFIDVPRSDWAIGGEIQG
jgi:phenylpyruvate tautomerase PptA (4-oxalocrotonate tautomerase family)